MPKGSEEEKAARSAAIQAATKYAIEVPFRTMKKAFEVFDICKKMVEIGNPNSVTDAGVGALCARSAVLGAYLNVKINAQSLKDKQFVDSVLQQAEEMATSARQIESEILGMVNAKI